MASSAQQENKAEEKLKGGSAKGQVQKAMGQIITVDNLWEQMRALEPLEEEFGEMMAQLSPGTPQHTSAHISFSLSRCLLTVLCACPHALSASLSFSL